MEQEFSPADINTKINEYKEVIMHFAALLENENQALRAYNIDVVTALLEEKTKLVTSYRAMVAYFIKNQEEFKTADNEAKQSLKDLSLKLDALMKENDALLKTKMETSRTVMDSIVRLAKVTSASSSTSYGAQGKYTPVDNTQNALAVNRTL